MMKSKRFELEAGSRDAHRHQPAGKTDRYVCMAAPCGHVFVLREVEAPGYFAGVRVVLFACGIVVFVELLLALLL